MQAPLPDATLMLQAFMNAFLISLAGIYPCVFYAGQLSKADLTLPLS